MVLFNYTSKELTAKIVYYGPGLCGKTTNLQFVYDSLPTHVKKGKMLSLATKTDRTLFFDFLPIELGRIRGMKTRVQLYTVPGQVFYNSTRKLVLKGADGVVFVADSQQKMMESNVESYKNLDDNLREIGLRLEEMPLVMQFNKRDLPHLASVEEMNTLVNRHNAPFYEAVATTGIGVEDTLKAITKLVLNHLATKYNLVAPAASRGTSAGEAESPPLPSPGPAAGSVPEEAEGMAVSGESGAMEIERFSQARDFRNDARVAGPIRAGEAAEEGGAAKVSRGTEEIAGEEDVFPLDAVPARDREEAPESTEGLEVVDLGEIDGPESVSDADRDPEPSTSPEAVGDLSDLLEEIPSEPGEEAFSILEEPVPGFTPRVEPISPGSAHPAPRTEAPANLRLVPEMPTVPAGRRPSAAPDAAISPMDPLGIGGARDSEMPIAKAIQVGAVTPGQEHQITVPLEMSVEGRRIRLNLRMTLTLSR